MPRVSPDLVYIKRNVISSARGGTQEFVKVDEFLRGMSNKSRVMIPAWGIVLFPLQYIILGSVVGLFKTVSFSKNNFPIARKSNSNESIDRPLLSEN